MCLFVNEVGFEAGLGSNAHCLSHWYPSYAEPAFLQTKGFWPVPWTPFLATPLTLWPATEEGGGHCSLQAGNQCEELQTTDVEEQLHLSEHNSPLCEDVFPESIEDTITYNMAH